MPTNLGSNPGRGELVTRYLALLSNVLQTANTYVALRCLQSLSDLTSHWVKEIELEGVIAALASVFIPKITLGQVVM